MHLLGDLGDVDSGDLPQSPTTYIVKSNVFFQKVYFKKVQLLQSYDIVLFHWLGDLLGDLLGNLGDVDPGDLPQLQQALHLLLTQAVCLCNLEMNQNQIFWGMFVFLRYGVGSLLLRISFQSLI